MADDQDDVFWPTGEFPGPFFLGPEAEWSDDPCIGYTIELPITLGPGSGDGSGETTLIVETSRSRPTPVPVRLRHFPAYDSKVYPAYDFLNETLHTDDQGRLFVPLSIAQLESRPFYWVTMRIEATPPNVSFSVRRMVLDRSENGPWVSTGFAHIG